MTSDFAEKVFKVRGQRSRSFLTIVCKLYCFILYLYSLEGAIWRIFVSSLI